MNAKEFLKQQCGYTDRDIEYNPNVTLKNALSFMTEFSKYSKGQTLPIDSVIICSRNGCNNEKYKGSNSYCLECTYERKMSGY